MRLDTPKFTTQSGSRWGVSRVPRVPSYVPYIESLLERTVGTLSAI